MKVLRMQGTWELMTAAWGPIFEFAFKALFSLVNLAFPAIALCMMHCKNISIKACMLWRLKSLKPPET